MIDPQPNTKKKNQSIEEQRTDSYLVLSDFESIQEKRIDSYLVLSDLEIMQLFSSAP